MQEISEIIKPWYWEFLQKKFRHFIWKGVYGKINEVKIQEDTVEKEGEVCEAQVVKSEQVSLSEKFQGVKIYSMYHIKQ